MLCNDVWMLFRPLISTCLMLLECTIAKDRSVCLSICFSVHLSHSWATPMGSRYQIHFTHKEMFPVSWGQISVLSLGVHHKQVC